LATHYADEISPSHEAPARILRTHWGEYRGKVYSEGSLSDVNSGLQSESLWLYEDDLMRLCRDAGYKDLTVVTKNPVAAEQYKMIQLVGKKSVKIEA
jgi:hypothetical protein